VIECRAQMYSDVPHLILQMGVNRQIEGCSSVVCSCMRNECGAHLVARDVDIVDVSDVESSSVCGKIGIVDGCADSS